MKTYRGKDLAETLALMEAYGEKSKVIAGGTDLVIQLRREKIKPQLLIDISTLGELKGMYEEGNWIYTGAGITFGEILQSPLLHREYKDLIYAAGSIGSPQIRNGGTLGGNLCNGSPAADMVPPLLALESEIIAESKRGQRIISLEDFFVEKGKTQLRPEELLRSIRFKKKESNQGLGFSKLGLRKALAIAKISMGVFVKFDESQRIQQCRIASGALGPYGLREREVESCLVGRVAEENSIDEAVGVLREVIHKRVGNRFSGGFKIQAVEGIFKQALYRALEDAHLYK